MEAMLSILVGVGLAAATGFRIFVPPLILSLAARSGHVELASSLEWLASDAALWSFAAATLLEVGAYYVPWLDNLLDTVATPAAVVAGVLVTGSMTGDLSPWLRWSVAVLAGGGTAAVFQGLTAGSRVISSATTLGLANPLVATLEAVASVVLTVLSISFPLLLVIALGALFWLAATRIAGRFGSRRRSVVADTG